MKRIHLIGRQNAGKTTLMVELLHEFARMGLRVGSIKHAGHDHEVDVPGKDSHRHRAAGAEPAAFVTPKTVAVFLSRPTDADIYAKLETLFADCDLVLVEGDAQTRARKIEVWRAETGQVPLALGVEGVRAVITDDPVEAAVPVWPRADVAAIAACIINQMRDVE